jgi:hypothetical protein
LQLSPELVIRARGVLKLSVLLGIFQAVRLIGLSLRVFSNLGSLGINTSGYIEGEGLLLRLKLSLLLPQGQLGLPRLFELSVLLCRLGAKIGELDLNLRAHPL